MYMLVPTAVAEWKSLHLAGLPWEFKHKIWLSAQKHCLDIYITWLNIPLLFIDVSNHLWKAIHSKKFSPGSPGI